MSRTRAVLTATVVLSALALGGCTDDDPEPKFSPPESTAPTSPSSTAAAGPVEPALPDEALGSDEASAEAFVKFYWDTVNYAQASGDVAPLRQLGARDCAACAAGAKYLEGVFGKGGQITGGVSTLTIKKSSLVHGDDGMHAVVKFALSTTPQSIDYPGREKDERYAGGTSTVNALLEPAAGTWIVSSWGIQK